MCIVYWCVYECMCIGVCVCVYAVLYAWLGVYVRFGDEHVRSLYTRMCMLHQNPFDLSSSSSSLNGKKILIPTETHLLCVSIRFLLRVRV
jgi:hypothetical protein